ncbi:MAG: HAD family hydrolase [Gammaproteobacteria bacterium]|nr:HAD family hydrolase [Gammaproteobacteria bacterium]
MRNDLFIKRFVLVCAIFFSTFAYSAEINDPLPSWNNGINKQSIIEFVQSVTDKKSKDYVQAKDRIATIDNDGTLWVEQPLYTQVVFIQDRFKELLQSHPEWKQQEPFKSILKTPAKQLSKKDMETLFAVTSSKMTVEEFNNTIKKWLRAAVNPHFKRHYTELVYQPMLEVINYLQANQFIVYIVSGGGQDFMRAFSEDVYHIPSEHVIGSTTTTQYTYQNNKPVLIKTVKPLFVSNYAGKPEAIDLFIGKKPIIAFGNSTGDQQMLEWTQSNSGKHLMLLVHHDDAKREYAYDTQSKVGTFPASLFKEAEKNNWHIISMKNDWKVVFPISNMQH